MTRLFTFTGISAADIPARLAEPFDDPKAYRGVPGAADLTDISTGHMLERLTMVFGPKGVGWNFLWSANDMEILNPLERRVLARLRFALFTYTLYDETGAATTHEIQTSGANANEMVYAEEGARTSALGAAIKGLCFQLPVYKGHLDHHSAGKPSGGNEGKPGGNGHKPLPEEAASQKLAGLPSQEAASMGMEEASTILDDLGCYILKTGTQSKGKLLGEIGIRTLGWFALTMKTATADQRADQEAALLYLAAKYLPVQEEEASLQQQAWRRVALLQPVTPLGKAAKRLASERQPA
jgi:hypothetical protein